MNDAAPVGAREFRVLTLEQLEGLGSPEHLVAGVLPRGGVGVLIGQSGAGKTLLGLDLALSIAARHPTWHGRAVRGGTVTYLSPEGVTGLRERVRAWMHANGAAEVPGIRFIPDEVQLLDFADTENLLEAIDGTFGYTPPSLIVLDTWAQCMPGGDENSVKDTMAAMHSVNRLRQATGAAVLILHHAGHQAPRERGSSALRAAVDVQLFLKEEDGLRTLEGQKNRDGPLLDRITFRLQPVLDSVVLVAADSALEYGGPTPTRREREALEVLQRIADAGGVSTSVWERACSMPVSTFFETRKRLLGKQLVTTVGGSRYAVSPAGLLQLLQRNSNGTPTPGASTPLHSSGSIRATEVGVQTSGPDWEVCPVHPGTPMRFTEARRLRCPACVPEDPADPYRPLPAEVGST